MLSVGDGVGVRRHFIPPGMESGLSARTTRVFSPESLSELSDGQYAHPDPHVQRRMEVLWLIGQGETQAARGNPQFGKSEALQHGGVNRGTDQNHVRAIRWQADNLFSFRQTQTPQAHRLALNLVAAEPRAFDPRAIKTCQPGSHARQNGAGTAGANETHGAR